MNDFDVRLGAYLKERRVARGLTQEGLATLIGRGATTVGKWEAGTAIPDRLSFERLCERGIIEIRAAFAPTRPPGRPDPAVELLELLDEHPDEHVVRLIADLARVVVQAERKAP